MTKEKRVSGLKIILKVFKRVKLRTLLLLGLTLSFNSFAWFIYATRVDSGISATVKSWNVAFIVGNESVEQVNFRVSDLYPGMSTYTDSITAYNHGDADATLSFEIENARILGTSYVVDGNTITSDALNNELLSSYPFRILLSVSSVTIPPGGSSVFSLTVSWPYESGCDEIDTYWGNLAYDFAEDNSGISSIELNVKVKAVQSS